MTKQEFKEKIRLLIKQVYSNRSKAEEAAVEYDELTKFPELKAVIVDLLTPEYDNFVASIDWVAPRPSTFRINLKNDQLFYLIYGKRSFIAQIEGKKYYLLNLPEEQHAAESIARILRYGVKAEEGEEGGEGFEDVKTDVNVDVEEPAAAEEPTEET